MAFKDMPATITDMGMVSLSLFHGKERSKDIKISELTEQEAIESFIVVFEKVVPTFDQPGKKNGLQMLVAILTEVLFQISYQRCYRL